MSENICKEKSKRFAVQIVRMYQHLTKDQKEFVLSKQVLRSGTSIGANIAESECAISRKDYLAKLYIALKECSETRYWLELLRDTDYLSETEFKAIYENCNELMRILSASTKTLRQSD